jgi:hypothetical protein
MSNEYIVYNLVFPEYVNEMNLGGYLFRRRPNYEESYSKMMWLVDSSGSEFVTKKQTGSHQATADVIEKGIRKSLPWRSADATKLTDICLLLSIFTGRDVFAVKKEVYETNPTLISDHRIFNYGGILHCSIAYEAEYFNEHTLERLTQQERMEDEYFFKNYRDIGFQKGVNKVIKLIRSRKWRKKYANGYFLLLFKQAIFRMDLETQFLLCWIIWEHLFAVLKRNKYSDKQLEKIEGKDKISNLFTTYFGITLNSKSRKEITKIAKTRKKLVHYGQKPENVDYKEMDLFIRSTECLICRILELEPSNLFNTNEKLANFLKIRR